MLDKEIIEDIKKVLADSVEGAVHSVQPSQSIELEKMDGQTDLKREIENETYKSDNEDEDKWDNIKKACWEGYTQRGMKDKGGKKVPNCVPVQKAEDLSEADQSLGKSLWGSKFDPTFINLKK
jgi:hypothetical protein